MLPGSQDMSDWGKFIQNVGYPAFLNLAVLYTVYLGLRHGGAPLFARLITYFDRLEAKNEKIVEMLLQISTQNAATAEVLRSNTEALRQISDQNSVTARELEKISVFGCGNYQPRQGKMGSGVRVGLQMADHQDSQ